MTRRLRLGPIPAMLALMLSACGTPDYYLLPAQTQPATRGLAPSRSVVVSDFSLPAYAEAVEIAAIEDEGAVRLQPGASWADEPRRALTRHFAAALALRLGSSVGTDPWPAFSEDPAYRVEVAVDRIIGRRGGVVDFSGQYFLLRAEDGNIAATDRFQIRVGTLDDSLEALVAAHARATEILADQVAAEIAGRPRAGS
jgi:uncharacterized protein